MLPDVWELLFCGRIVVPDWLCNCLYIKSIFKVNNKVKKAQLCSLDPLLNKLSILFIIIIRGIVDVIRNL